MTDDLTVLESKEPQIAQFLRDWRTQYENRKFDFSVETDQADFYEAVVEMARHIAHTAQSAKLATVMSVAGVSTVYFNVTPARNAT